MLYAAVFATFGFIGWVNPPSFTDTTDLPVFIRPMRPNCGEVFYCINSTDPNPSYISYWIPSDGPLPAPSLPAFVYNPSIFDVSDPFLTTVRVPGIYDFTVFTGVISFTSPFNVGIVLMRDTGAIFATPALSGSLGTANTFNLTAFPTHAGQAVATVKLNAGDAVRVGYVVSTELATVTPGSYIAGKLVSRE